LTVNDMLGGQFRSMLKRFFKPLLCVLALDLALFMTGFGGSGTTPNAGMLLLIQGVVVATFLIDVVAVGAFGIWQGLRNRRIGRAALLTVAWVMGLPTFVFSVVVFLWVFLGAVRGTNPPGDPRALVALWFFLSTTNAAFCISAALKHLREDFR